MTDMVIRWSNQNSWSSNLPGLLAMADLLEQDFSGLGVTCQRTTLPPWNSLDDEGQSISHPTGPALLWLLRPDAARRVLLLIHYDTVYPPTSPPCTAGEIDGGRLVGPGVADAKGGIAVILFALQAIQKFKLADNLGITVLLNPDEEVGSHSTSRIFCELAPQFDFALVFEPTLADGALVANRKGSANFTAIIRGRAAHAGRNRMDGRNALVHIARLATEVDSWNHLYSDISVNVGRISGGGPLNQVPDFATMSMNVRVGTANAAVDVIAKTKALEQRYSSTDGYTCSIQGHFHSPPKCIDGDSRFNAIRHRVVSAAAQINRPITWQDTGGSCDGNKLAALGLPNVDTMGVTGGELHSPKEYCHTASLLSATKTLVHLIAQTASES
jgi:glutamate carboxypeptidase